MKNSILVLFVSLFTFGIINAQVITTQPVSKTEYCFDEQITIPFTVSGAFNSDNVFIAQISDANGSFNSFSKISTLKGTGSGSISSKLPSDLVKSNKYRVRVISSSPYEVGSDNGVDINIKTSLSSKIKIPNPITLLKVNEKHNFNPFQTKPNLPYDPFDFYFHWDFGDSANFSSFDNYYTSDIFYLTPGRRTVTFSSSSQNYCNSDNIDSLQINVVDCTARIDSTTIVIDSSLNSNDFNKITKKSNIAKFWILPNGSIEVNYFEWGHPNIEFYLETGASLILHSTYELNSLLVYLKSGSSLEFGSVGTNYGNFAIYKTKGSSIKFDNKGDSALIYNYKVTFCPNLKYSYGEAPKDGIKIMQELGYLGVEDYKSEELSILPNMTSGIIKLGSNFENTNIEVYSTLGELVYQNKNTNEIDISRLSDGIYFVKIGEKVSKIMKIKN